jgi:GDP-mannose 4,6 dehydratase
MNLLITGGAGFIGSNLIHHVIDDARIAKLVNLDCLTYAGHLANLEKVSANKKYVFEKVDLRDKAATLHVVEKYAITHVMHLAVESRDTTPHPTRSAEWEAATTRETHVYHFFSWEKSSPSKCLGPSRPLAGNRSRTETRRSVAMPSSRVSVTFAVFLIIALNWWNSNLKLVWCWRLVLRSRCASSQKSLP